MSKISPRRYGKSISTFTVTIPLPLSTSFRNFTTTKRMLVVPSVQINRTVTLWSTNSDSLELTEVQRKQKDRTIINPKVLIRTLYIKYQSN